MYFCDLINFDGGCEACPFSNYGDCQFSCKEVVVLELQDIVDKAKVAKKALELLEG